LDAEFDRKSINIKYNNRTQTISFNLNEFKTGVGI
jgi:hypothetical protein